MALHVMDEANHCLGCKVPRCQQGCPIHTNIPEVIRLLKANNLDEAKLESELADRSLRQAEENRRVSKSQYEVGLETLSDHLEAQALWQQAYETQVDARFQLYLNYVAYLKAAGTLHDKL